MHTVTTVSSGPKATAGPGRLRTWSARTAFLLLSGAIVVISSEKFYWYPQAFAPLAFVELVGFYSLAVAATFVAAHRYRASGFEGLTIVSIVFALVVEGIVTPVLYEDGPLPVMALYFVGWHGLFSVVFGWYTIRRLALQGRSVALGICGALQGVGWGLWSTSYWRAETIAEMRAENASGEGIWEPGQWPVSKFAAYAMISTGVFIAGHWLLGYVWPSDWAITRRWRRTLWALLAAGLLLMTIVVPWAPLKLAGLGYPVLVLLRRFAARSDGPSVFAELRGRIPLVRLAPLAISAPCAIGAYWLMMRLDPSEATLDVVLWTFVFATLGAGLLAVFWLIARSAGRLSGPV